MDPKNFSHNAPGSLHFSPAGYWTYIPYALPPVFRWTDQLVTALSGADRPLAQLTERLRGVPAAFFELTARLEAVESCRMAGLDVSAEDLFRYEAGYRRSEESGANPVEVVARYADALANSCGRSRGRELNLRAIERLHGDIWQGSWDRRWPPGEFRDGPTWISGADGGPESAEFVPPPVEEMWGCLDSLAAFILDEPRLPRLVQLAMVHYQLEVIHPFYDANARLSRLLIPILLCEWTALTGPALRVSEYFRHSRAEYDALQVAVSRENAWEPWLLYFLRGLEEEAERSLGLLDRLNDLRVRMAAQLETGRTADRMGQILDLLLYHPLVNVRQIEAVLPGGNFKSATRYVERLVEKRVLKEITGQGRHRVFLAAEVMECIGLPVLEDWQP